MSGRFVAHCKRRFEWCLAGAVMLAVTWSANQGRAQSGPAVEAPAVGQASHETSSTTSGVVQTGCSSCGGGIGSLPPLTDPTPGSTEVGCGGAHCVPGGKYCDCCCNSDNCVGKFFCGLYECICCPDPCFEYHWTPVQDSAFFVDSVRPRTQMKIRVDAAWNLQDADRGEWFMARFNTVSTPNSAGALVFPFFPKSSTQPLFPATTNQVGSGDPCAPANLAGKGVHYIPRRVDYEDLSLYTESGTDRAGVFIEVKYRELDPHEAAINTQVGSAVVTAGPVTTTLPGSGLGSACTVSAFGDMIIGTKSVIVDCELIQLGMQFKTYLPTGNFLKGIGTGHVSLEPSILATVKLAPTWYAQLQTSYWIPIVGDSRYQSNVWHNHASVNHLLWAPCHDIQIVGTLEANAWTFFQGAYTETDWLLAPGAGVVVPAGVVPGVPGALPGGISVLYPAAIGAGDTMASAGPGIRLFICDKIDVGVGAAFSITGTHLEKEIIRTEFRWRF